MGEELLLKAKVSCQDCWHYSFQEGMCGLVSCRCVNDPDRPLFKSVEVGVVEAAVKFQKKGGEQGDNNGQGNETR